MRLRRLALAIALIVFGAVPAAVALMADPFGPVEVADPTWHPGTNMNEITPFFAVDANGNALLATIYWAPGHNGDDQFAVLERCGSGPATWQRTVLTNVAGGVLVEGLRVASNGTAMAVWRVTGGGATTHYSAVRPPGGEWGAPQPIVSKLGVNNVQFDLNASGDAIAVWAESSPAATYASLRPAGGTWGAAEKVVDSSLQKDVAIANNGDAVLLYRNTTPGFAYSKYRPAGGAWGAAVKVIENNFQDTMKQLDVAFDGQGGTVAIATFNETITDALRVNTGTNGGWGPVNQQLDDKEPNTAQYRFRNVVALVRHPSGAVAVWRRVKSSQNDPGVVVSRWNGAAWDTPKVFESLDDDYGNAAVATNGAGEIVVAASLHSGTGIGVDDIRAAIAPSISGTWGAMTLVSPAGTAADLYRDPIAAGGGSAFYVGWGVHGAGNQRTEVISTKAAGATCGAASTPTPTATASATASPSPSPDPLPLPSPTPTATPAPSPPAVPATPSAIADFTTLPAASKCVRGRKLTVKFKKPPKGYVVKTVTVKVNAKKVATVKGAKLKKPLYLRKLPKGTFTITVSVTLTKGKGLTERRRYTACK